MALETIAEFLSVITGKLGPAGVGSSVAPGPGLQSHCQLLFQQTKELLLLSPHPVQESAVINT
jgi:hypothetical protein